LATCWPSRKCTASKGPSTWDFTATVAKASTRPMVSTRTGRERVSAIPRTTGTPCGAAVVPEGFVDALLALEAVSGPSEAARLFSNQ